LLKKNLKRGITKNKWWNTRIKTIIVKPTTIETMMFSAIKKSYSPQ